MSFNYQNFTISGSRPEVEGTSEFVTKAKEFLEGVGWITEDDRRTQPGSAVDADTHKIVMKSDGEDNTLPNFYMTIASGTTSTPASNTLSFMMSTGYDVGTHDVLPSDAKINDNLGAAGSVLNAPSLVDYEVWMSGDSEGVVFITRNASTYGSCYIGRCKQFTNEDIDPYPLYMIANGSALAAATSTARVITGNPPSAAQAASEAESLGIQFATANQPYTGDHTSVDSIYLAMPLIITMDDGTPLRKGVVGTAQNVWQGAGTSAGMLQEGTLTASGSFGVQVYRAFTVSTVRSLIIRQS